MTATEGSSGDPMSVPRRLFPGANGHVTHTVATNQHLVGLGGSEELALTVDLDSGAVEDFDAPEDLPPWPAVSGASAGSRSVVVAFSTPRDLDPDGGPPDSSVDPAYDRFTYRFDPADGTWDVLQLPAEIASGRRASLTAIGAVGDDGAAAVYQSADAREAVLLVLEDDASLWTEVSRWSTEQAPGELGSAMGCATRDAWWELRGPTSGEIQDDGTADVSAGVTTYSLRRTTFGDGTRHEVPVPDLPPEYGPAPVELGCGESTVAMAAGRTGSQPAAAAYAYTGDEWIDVGDALGERDAHIASSVSGGAGGPAFVFVPFAPGQGPTDQSDAFVAIVDRDGAAIADLNVFGSEIIWRGGRDELLVLGPLGIEREMPTHIPLRRLEV